jgi:hypothetical protein
MDRVHRLHKAIEERTTERTEYLISRGWIFTGNHLVWFHESYGTKAFKEAYDFEVSREFAQAEKDSSGTDLFTYDT